LFERRDHVVDMVRGLDARRFAGFGEGVFLLRNLRDALRLAFVDAKRMPVLAVADDENAEAREQDQDHAE
jgi:hypothetical protein